MNFEIVVLIVYLFAGNIPFDLIPYYSSDSDPATEDTPSAERDTVIKNTGKHVKTNRRRNFIPNREEQRYGFNGENVENVESGRIWRGKRLSGKVAQ